MFYLISLRTAALISPLVTRFLVVAQEGCASCSCARHAHCECFEYTIIMRSHRVKKEEDLERGRGVGDKM